MVYKVTGVRDSIYLSQTLPRVLAIALLYGPTTRVSSLLVVP